MNIGGLAAGLAQGINAGVNMANTAAARDNEARRLGIMEQGAKLEQETRQRALDKDKRQEAVYSELAQLVEQAGGAAPGPEGANLTPEQRVSFGLHSNVGLMKNPDFLNKAAGLFMKAGMPEGIKWLEHGHAASKENAVQMTQALLNGDTHGALTAYNASGKQATAIEPVVGADGKPTGRYRVVLGDGQAAEVDPKVAYRSLLSPSEFFKLQREESETAAKNEYYLAGAEALRGKNQTAVDVAATRADGSVRAAGVNADGRVEAANVRADASVTAAGIRGGGGGRGRGTGGGGTGARAKWMEDLEKSLPQTDELGPDGKPKVDAKTGEPKQAVDKSLAPGIRDLARMNDESLDFAGVAPQEAADTLGQIVTTFKSTASAPGTALDILDEKFGLVFGRDGAGDGKSVAVRVGTAQDGSPILVRLTDAQQKVLLAEDAKRRQKQATDTETARMQSRFPAAKYPPQKPKGREASGKIVRPAAAGGIPKK